MVILLSMMILLPLNYRWIGLRGPGKFITTSKKGLTINCLKLTSRR
jgi:hypothetical protein